MASISPASSIPQDGPPGTEDAQIQARKEPLFRRDGETAHPAIADGDGGGVDFHQDFVLPRIGFGKSLSTARLQVVRLLRREWLSYDLFQFPTDSHVQTCPGEY
jgi:hypothetical protein